MNPHALHRSVAVLVHRIWPPVVVLACSAIAGAAASNLLAASALSPATSAPRITVQAGQAPPATAEASGERPLARVALRDQRGRDFTARNMFCSTCTAAPAVAGAGDTFAPQAILIATIIGDEPRCTVRALESDAQGDYGVGDSIAGVGAITRIGWRSIDVADREGHHGHLDLLDPPAAARGEAGAATPAPAAAADAPWAGRIKKIDDHTFEVDRELVRDMVSGATKPGGARILPKTEGGKLVGLRMFGVKEPSLASALGLKNGDVMTSINNTPITSAQTLLDVYGKIDSLNVVEINGTRGDKPLLLDLRLR